MYPFFLLLLSLLFVMVSWRDLRWGLFLIAAFLPSYLLRFEMFGVPMTFLEVMILLVVGVCVVRYIKTPRGHDSPGDHMGSPLRTRWLVGVLLFLLAGTVGVLIAPDKLIALGVWKAYFVEPVLLFFVAVYTLRSKKDLHHLLASLAAGSLFVSGFALAQWVFSIGIPAPWDIERRVTSVFAYPNALGLYLGPILAIAGVELVRTISSKERSWLFWSLVLLLGVPALYFSESEAAWIAVLGTWFFASLLSKKLRRISLPLAIIGILFIALIPAVRTPVVEKVTFQDYSGSTRLTQWEETLPLLKDNWLFGVGLSQYPTALVPYHTHEHIEIFQYPHNSVLNFWVETGLLGLLAVLWLVVVVVIEAVNAIVSKRDIWIPLAALAAFVDMDIHGLVDVPYFKNDLAAMSWLLVALVFLATYDSRQDCKK